MKSLFKNPSLVFSALVLLGALFWQASEVLRGWDHNILAHQGFRQTQTAISAYYFLKDGFSLYTIIPVFGPPWILPYEFPLFQWILAATVKLAGSPIDQTGRAISILFHLLSLLLTFRILRFFNTSIEGSLFTLSIVSLSPLGIYWSQGLLIESFSVTLTLTYILCISLAMHSRSKLGLAAGIVFGVLSAVVKVTTFAVGWGFLILYGLYWLHQNRNKSKWRYSTIGTFWLIPLFVPVLVAVSWTYHTGAILAALPLSPDGTSHLQWFFGTPGARLDPDQWIKVLKHTILYTLGTPFPLIIAIIPLCLPGTSRLKTAVFFCTALSGPLVFWNVYYVHDYYAYEILFFICITIGLCFEEGLKVSGRWQGFALQFLKILLLGSMIGGYYHTPYAWLLRNDHKADQKLFFEEVSELVDGEAFLLTAGMDWDPSAAYSTKRRTLAIRWNGWIYTDFFMEVYEDTLNSGYQCGGILINGENVPAPMLQEMIDMFGMEQTPALSLNESLLFFQKR